jgi:hypothetical protein
MCLQLVDAAVPGQCRLEDAVAEPLTPAWIQFGRSFARSSVSESGGEGRRAEPAVRRLSTAGFVSRLFRAPNSSSAATRSMLTSWLTSRCNASVMHCVASGSDSSAALRASNAMSADAVTSSTRRSVAGFVQLAPAFPSLHQSARLLVRVPGRHRYLPRSALCRRRFVTTPSATGSRPDCPHRPVTRPHP